MANSGDGGVTFGEPTALLKTWGAINSASADGRFAIVYRSGAEAEQQVSVAVTADNGATWVSAVASGDLPLYFDVTAAPGIRISPNGTIDLVFYAPAGSPEDCALTIESWRKTLPFGRVDPCEYDVYYTFGTLGDDGGLSFAEPLRLNPQPIRGVDFVRVQGGSQAGSHLAVAAGADFACPIWVGTPQAGKTQIFTACIER